MEHIKIKPKVKELPFSSAKSANNDMKLPKGNPISVKNGIGKAHKAEEVPNAMGSSNYLPYERKMKK